MLEPHVGWKGRHSMIDRKWKIGELAKETGLSIRTLHYYEQIGLLRASERTESGHRRYNAADIERLQRILSMRELGLSLEEIRQGLTEPAYALAPVIELHLARLGEQIAHQQRLFRRLTHLSEQMRQAAGIPVTDLLATMEAITMLNHTLSQAQQEAIMSGRQAYKATHGRDFEHDLQALVTEARAHLDAGDQADCPAMQQLARRWADLRQVIGGGDPAMATALRQVVQDNPEHMQRLGMDPALLKYLSEAQAAGPAQA